MLYHQSPASKRMKRMVQITRSTQSSFNFSSAFCAPLRSYIAAIFSHTFKLSFFCLLKKLVIFNMGFMSTKLQVLAF